MIFFSEIFVLFDTLTNIECNEFFAEGLGSKNVYWGIYPTEAFIWKLFSQKCINTYSVLIRDLHGFPKERRLLT